jgi:hypothetical protein
MKPSSFEETFTLWLDGQFGPDESTAFEKEMRDRGFDPAAERAEAGFMQSLLRDHSEVPVMPHADFFSRQLLHRIEDEERQAVPMPTEKVSSRFLRWFGLPRMAWAGIASLIVAGALFKFIIPVGGHAPLEDSDYFAKVVDSRTFDPSVSASTVYTPRDNVTVLWIDGLDYLPADYALQ